MSTDSKNNETAIIPIERISGSIHLVREQKVMLDRDLAVLYGVKTKALVQSVRRNLERFPSDFMFQLSSQELADLRSQGVTSSSCSGTRYPPYAFTEAGVGMLSSVLRSPRAVAVNIAIVRAFIALRQHALTNKDLYEKLAALEQKYDGKFTRVLRAFRKLLDQEPQPHKPTSGFAREENQIGCWPCR